MVRQLGGNRLDFGRSCRIFPGFPGPLLFNACLQDSLYTFCLPYRNTQKFRWQCCGMQFAPAWRAKDRREEYLWAETWCTHLLKREISGTQISLGRNCTRLMPPKSWAFHWRNSFFHRWNVAKNCVKINASKTARSRSTRMSSENAYPDLVIRLWVFIGYLDSCMWRSTFSSLADNCMNN